jgi:putative endonuclease
MAEAYRQALGKAGEDLACRELRRRGCAILARRFRTRMGEIDIIARDGETIVFIEVKARAGEAWGSPAEAVTPAKQRRLVRMAADYLARARHDGRPCRFDVVTVAMDGGVAKVTWYPNAFAAGGQAFGGSGYRA